MLRNGGSMKLTVLGQTEQTLTGEEGRSMLDVLLEGGIYISAPCGGNGRCGKCRVQLVDGECAPSSEDLEVFSKEELAAGMRLACRAFPKGDCTIRICAQEEQDFEVLSDVAGQQQTDAGGQHSEGDVLIAIDIGTTTLAIGLVDAENGAIIDTYTGVNHQRAYGADVISRIHAFDEGKGADMTASIKKDLLTGMTSLLLKNNVDAGRISRVVIAGNTTMGHLLLGYDCHGLGQVPFTPVNLQTVTMPFAELFGVELLQAPVTVLPGFSTFVGADIVSGLLACRLYEAEKVSLLVDLGTNGEMAIGNRDRLLVTSTAAGPAFEGGNISCGVGSIAGAICEVELSGEETHVTTLGGQPPIGLCGTGVIEATAELLKEEWLDETGLLDEDYFDDGFVLAKRADGSEIAFTQKDIRELQLAKAAVRAGMETLLVRYGIGYDEVETVYVAGGFGVHLNMEKAVSIGLFPEELLGKIKAVGNTSLGGAIAYARMPEAEEICQRMIAAASEVDLSTDQAFQEYYMDAMFFE